MSTEVDGTMTSCLQTTTPGQFQLTQSSFCCSSVTASRRLAIPAQFIPSDGSSTIDLCVEAPVESVGACKIENQVFTLCAENIDLDSTTIDSATGQLANVRWYVSDKVCKKDTADRVVNQPQRYVPCDGGVATGSPTDGGGAITATSAPSVFVTAPNNSDVTYPPIMSTTMTKPALITLATFGALAAFAAAVAVVFVCWYCCVKLPAYKRWKKASNGSDGGKKSKPVVVEVDKVDGPVAMQPPPNAAVGEERPPQNPNKYQSNYKSYYKSQARMEKQRRHRDQMRDMHNNPYQQQTRESMSHLVRKGHPSTKRQYPETKTYHEQYVYQPYDNDEQQSAQVTRVPTPVAKEAAHQPSNEPSAPPSLPPSSPAKVPYSEVVETAEEETMPIETKEDGGHRRPMSPSAPPLVPPPFYPNPKLVESNQVLKKNQQALRELYDS